MAYQFSNFHKENIYVKNLQVKINKPYCHCKKGLVPAMLAMASYTRVDIITALNSQKDRINELGSARFAADTGQTLTDFYSVDTLGVESDPATGRKP